MSNQPYNNIGECLLNEGFLDSLIGKSDNKTELDYSTVLSNLKKAIDDLEIGFERSIFKPVRFAFNKSYVPNFFLTNARKYETTIVYKAILPIKAVSIFKALGLSENLVMNELYSTVNEVDRMQPYFNINTYYTDIMKDEIEILITLNENYCLPSYYNTQPKKSMTLSEANNILNKFTDLAIANLKKHPLGQFLPFNSKSVMLFDIDGFYNSRGKFISNPFNYSSIMFNGIEYKGMDIFLNLYYYLEDSCKFNKEDLCLGLYSESDNTGELYLRIKPNYEVK